MRIGIDISQISYKGTGVSRFTEGLVNTILKHDSINTWIFFYSSLRIPLDTILKEKIESTRHKCIEYRFPSTFLTFIWNTIHFLPIETMLGKLDIFISSDWTEPPAKCNKTTIVHDLAFMRYPETIHPTILKNQQKRMYWVTKESKFIIADSLSTKNDLIRYFHCKEGKIDVLYPGVNDALPVTNSKSTLKKFHLNNPFIFTVGKIEPRKNIKRLLMAYNKLQKDTLLPDLVIAGQQGWDEKLNLSPLTNYKIHFLGQITDDELADLYRSCLFFIYPSLWEGFGYPIVEAMNYSAAVATSNTSSMVEIANHCALLFNPLDINSIANSIKMLVDNKDLRLNLQKKGTIRARDFSWKIYYQRLIKLIVKNIT